jgi:hypothetical protein
MDTYGHLLPEQHAEAVGGMASMMNPDMPLAATGTAGTAPAVETAVAVQNQATASDGVRRGATGEKKGPTLRIHGKTEEKSDSAREKASGHDGIRTHTPVAREGILSPQCLPFHHVACGWCISMIPKRHEPTGQCSLLAGWRRLPAEAELLEAGLRLGGLQGGLEAMA